MKNEELRIKNEELINFSPPLLVSSSPSLLLSSSPLPLKS
jgi:hypothetical protein